VGFTDYGTAHVNAGAGRINEIDIQSANERVKGGVAGSFGVKTSY